MKLILTQQPNMSESEIEIRYSDLDSELENLITLIKKGVHYIPCTDNDTGIKYRLPVKDIVYIETVDRKTFLYTASAMYRSEMKLHQLLDKLETFGFAQANKSCVVNLDTVVGLKMLFNRKAEITLSSGERISVSRTYIPDIRNAFDREGGNMQ